MKYFTHETTRMLSSIAHELRAKDLPSWARRSDDGMVMVLRRGCLSFHYSYDKWDSRKLYVHPRRGKPVEVSEHDGPWVQAATHEIHMMRHELDADKLAKQTADLIKMEDLERAWGCFE